MQIQTYADRACTVKAFPIEFPEVGSYQTSSGNTQDITIGEDTYHYINGAVKIRNFATAPAKLFAQYTSDLSEVVYIKTSETGDSILRLTLMCGETAVIDPSYYNPQDYRYQITLEWYDGAAWRIASSGASNISSDFEYNFYTAAGVLNGELMLMLYYQSTTDLNGTNVHGFFASSTLFDMSIRGDTQSQTPTVTPNGWYGTGTTTPGNMTFSDAPSALSHGNATAHGLRVYAVSDAQMERLYQTLWSSSIWDRWKNQKFNPIAGILSYHRLPITITADTMDPEISVCGQKYVMGTALSAPRVVKDCMPAVDCKHPLYNPSGVMPVPEVAGSYLDYQPYCSAVLHLPFIGNVPVSVNAISGGSIAVRYWIDVCSGNCLAHVLTTDRNGSSIVYGEYAGNCAYKYPITGNDNGGFAILGAAAGIATAGIAAVATEGAAAPFAAAIVSGGASALSSEHHTQQVGTWPANSAAMCDTNVYLLITRPAYLTPDHYPEIKGRPAGSGKLIGDYTGMLAGTMHADGISYLTDNEKAMIEKAFQNGVIV